METIISEFNNLKVYYTNKKKTLPKFYREKVDTHWKNLLRSGKSFFNGDVFTIDYIETDKNGTNIYVGLTDYAHFLYTIYQKNYDDNDCRVIYASVLIETSDKKFAIGEMNEETAFPFKLQFIGGGIDKGDINGETIDLEHSIKKEILEELGMEINNKSVVKSLRPYYLKSGGESNFLSVIFKMDLSINEDKLRVLLNNHNEDLASKMEMREIRSLVFVEAKKEAVEEFIIKDKRQKDENLIPALEAAVGIRPVLVLREVNNGYKYL